MDQTEAFNINVKIDLFQIATHKCSNYRYATQGAVLTYHTEIAKFVTDSNSVMIKDAAGSNKARMAVVREDHHLVFLPFVSHKMKALLYITDNDAIAYAVDIHYEIWNVLREEGKCMI